MRIDKLLWFLRFTSSRSFAQDWVADGHIRLNRRRVERCSTCVRTGDVLALPLRTGVRIIEILALPERRGPSAEAQGCYRVLDDGAKLDQSAVETRLPEGNEPQ